MIKDSITILFFGLPGSGKNTAGEYLQDQYGFFFFDGDSLITKVQKDNHKKGIHTTNEQRDVQFNNIIKKIKALQKQHTKLAIASWLPQRYQKQFAKAFPDIVFVLISAPQDQIVQRLAARRGHYISKEYALHISKQWGSAVIGHSFIENNEGLEQFLKKIDAFVLLSGSN